MSERKALPCEACGEGSLHPQISWNEVEYKGRKGKICRHHSVCDKCGADLADADEMRLNRREWRRFCKEIDNVPLGKEIAAMRKRHGLTQEQAGRLFGGGPVAFSKYENDDLIPDEAMTNLLYMAIRHPEVVTWLAERKEITPRAQDMLEVTIGKPLIVVVGGGSLQEWKMPGVIISEEWSSLADLGTSGSTAVSRQRRFNLKYRKGAGQWVPPENQTQH